MTPDFIFIAPANASEEDVIESSAGLKAWLDRDPATPLVLPAGWQLQKLDPHGHVVATYGVPDVCPDWLGITSSILGLLLAALSGAVVTILVIAVIGYVS